MAEETYEQKLARLGLGVGGDPFGKAPGGGLVVGPSLEGAIATEKARYRQELQQLEQAEAQGRLNFGGARRIQEVRAWLAEFDK